MSIAIFSAVTAGARAIGSIRNSRDMNDAADATDALAKKNAQLQRAENTEVERRQGRKDVQLMGEANARRYASGYSAENVGGSSDTYLVAVEAEQATQMDWLRQSGESKAQLIEEQGRIQSGNLRREAQGQVLQSFGSFAQMGFFASEGGMFRGDTPAPNVTNPSYGTGGKKLTVPANATNTDWSAVA